MGILAPRRAPTQRFVEWIGLIAAEALLLSAGVILWPRFAWLFLPNLVLLGLIGLVSVTLDREGRSLYWGLLTWATAGGVACLSLFVGTLGSVVAPLWGAMVGFLVAALVADRRRDQLPGIPASLLGGWVTGPGW